jgi:hypothetical protein
VTTVEVGAHQEPQNSSSSAVLATTVNPGQAEQKPAASFAPPVPPARATTFIEEIFGGRPDQVATTA